MIDNQFVKMMARYNQWQNESIYAAADELGEEERLQQRGAFFGSIHQTLCHLLWGDMIWTSRFAQLGAPGVNSIALSSTMIKDWQELKSMRFQRDVEIIEWANSLDQGMVEGDLSWFSGALNKNVKRPLAELLVHFFNHQTHHRGQVHAMITSAGGNPDDTDLFVMSTR